MIHLKKAILYFYRLLSNFFLKLKFTREFIEFKRLSNTTNKRFPVLWKNRYPFLKEKTKTSNFDRHYFFHTAWAARLLARLKPKSHVDIASYVYFAGIISAFIPVKFFEYRPANIQLNNLTSGSADLVKLPFKDNSIFSLSCMHVVEHIGLGRYGDSLDYDADLKAMSELQRVLSRGGNLLFVVPVGKPKLLFNAHRIYSYKQIITAFSSLKLKEFSLIPDDSDAGGLISKTSEKLTNNQTFGCGCFWFTKT